MAIFTTRVELVNPDSNDYALLHQEMRDREFYQVISFCGKWHDLPPGEYDRTSTWLKWVRSTAMPEQPPRP